MKTDSLLHQTRIHFPRLDLDTVRIIPIEKGGSGRRFYRVHSSAEQKLILVKYDPERSENRQYVEIARFLEKQNVRAPKIYHHDAEEALIWIEDLGEEDLFSQRDESWMVRRVLYESALDEVAKLHRVSERDSNSIRSRLSAEFNAALYLWEQSYFFENCLGRYFQLENAALEELAALPALHRIADELDRLPRVLVHRDFQSQNIIVRNGLAYLIDFQGMRPGRPEYDLASLLFDPYVVLSDSERGELIEYYLARQKEHGWDLRAEVERILPFCAIQRLMQALGAYGFLGLVKGYDAFLRYVPTAMNLLHSFVSAQKGLERLDDTLGRCLATQSGPVPSMAAPAPLRQCGADSAAISPR